MGKKLFKFWEVLRNLEDVEETIDHYYFWYSHKNNLASVSLKKFNGVLYYKIDESEWDPIVDGDCFDIFEDYLKYDWEIKPYDPIKELISEFVLEPKDQKTFYNKLMSAIKERFTENED